MVKWKSGFSFIKLQWNFYEQFFLHDKLQPYKCYILLKISLLRTYNLLKELFMCVRARLTGVKIFFCVQENNKRIPGLLQNDKWMWKIETESWTRSKWSPAAAVRLNLKDFISMTNNDSFGFWVVAIHGMCKGRAIPGYFKLQVSFPG